MKKIHYDYVKNEKLGYGIVLEKEKNKIIPVYFSECKCTRNMIADHPFMTLNPELSLNDFVMQELYEPLFDYRTVNKGLSYSNNKHVMIAERTNHSIKGYVKGTYLYTFAITIEKGKGLTLYCECPVEGECKHLYAVFTYLRELIMKETPEDPYSYTIRKNLKNLVYSTYPIDFLDFIEFITYVRDKDLIRTVYKEAEDSNYFYTSNHSIEKLVLPLLLIDAKIRESHNKLMSHNPPRIAVDNQHNYEKIVSDISSNSVEKIQFRLASYIYHKDIDNLLKMLNGDKELHYLTAAFYKAVYAYLSLNDVSLDEIIAIRSSKFYYEIKNDGYIELPKSPQKSINLILTLKTSMLENSKWLSMVTSEQLMQIINGSNFLDYYLLEALLDKCNKSSKVDYQMLADTVLCCSNKINHSDFRTYLLLKDLSLIIPNNYFVSMIVDGFIENFNYE